MNRKALLITLVAIAVLVIAFFIFWPSKDAAPELASTAVIPTPQSVVWGGPKNISMLPLIAERKGFFKAEGLNTRPNYLQTGKLAMDAVVSRDLDFGVLVDTNIAFVKFQEGADIRVVANIIKK
ncbi:MAG TPA: ABC transporter substrate-binding protein, partial [Thermoanaerobaculia bacterium]|nr:ABC transporter substrate-binding protein [Thermoanaerobaculia bacterium]